MFAEDEDVTTDNQLLRAIDLSHNLTNDYLEKIERILTKTKNAPHQQHIKIDDKFSESLLKAAENIENTTRHLSSADFTDEITKGPLHQDLQAIEHKMVKIQAVLTNI